jgi:hypothetical protein
LVNPQSANLHVNDTEIAKPYNPTAAKGAIMEEQFHPDSAKPPQTQEDSAKPPQTQEDSAKPPQTEEMSLKPPQAT